MLPCFAQRLKFHFKSNLPSNQRDNSAVLWNYIKVSSRCLCMLQYLMCPAKRRQSGERNRIQDRLFCYFYKGLSSLLTLSIHKQRCRYRLFGLSSHTQFISHRNTERETTPSSSNNRPPPFRGMVRLFLLLRSVALTSQSCMPVWQWQRWLLGLYMS